MRHVDKVSAMLASACIKYRGSEGRRYALMCEPGVKQTGYCVAADCLLHSSAAEKFSCLIFHSTSLSGRCGHSATSFYLPH